MMGKMMLTLTLLTAGLMGEEIALFPPILDEELIFAHFGNGSGLVSEILLYGTEKEAETSVRLLITDEGGRPMSLSLNGTPIGGVMDTSIPAAGMRRFKTSGSGPLMRGSVRVLSNRPLEGVILFGGEFGLAGVGSSAALEAAFLTPVEMDGLTGVATGIAVANLEASRVELELELYDPAGELVDSAEASLVASGQIARFLDEFDWSSGSPRSTFEGTVKVFSSGRIAATALRTGPRQLASLPVTALTAEDGSQPRAVCLGSWSGTYDDGKSSRITFRVVDQSTISSIQVHYVGCNGQPAVATAASGTIREDRSFSIPVFGSGILGNVQGRFAGDGGSTGPGSPSGVFILKQCGGGSFSWRATPQEPCSE